MKISIHLFLLKDEEFSRETTIPRIGGSDNKIAADVQYVSCNWNPLTCGKH